MSRITAVCKLNAAKATKSLLENRCNPLHAVSPSWEHQRSSSALVSQGLPERTIVRTTGAIRMHACLSVLARTLIYSSIRFSNCLFYCTMSISICWPTYLSNCLSVDLSIYVSMNLSSIYVSVCLSVGLSIGLSVYLSICLSVDFSTSELEYLSISIYFFYLSVYLST